MQNHLDARRNPRYGKNGGREDVKTHHTRDAPISVDSKVYFESYTVTRSKISTVIRFGKGIYDFNYVPLICREFDKNDKEYPSTHFVMLNKDAMLKYCNIDYNALLDAVQHVPFSKDYSHSLNALLLEMLKAYDESKNSRIELLSTATTLALWIKDSDPYTEHPIAILNYLQSVKRSRTLTSTEQAEILSLIEAAQDNESIYVGAYLLLDNPVAAKIHFDKLPEESQKFFESCPIYHFMPNGQPTISAPTEG